jgi:hypothetical protein
MKGMVNEMYTVSLLQQPDDSYLFHGMPRKEFQAVFNVAKFLNTQATGLTL